MLLATWAHDRYFEGDEVWSRDYNATILTHLSIKAAANFTRADGLLSNRASESVNVGPLIKEEHEDAVQIRGPFTIMANLYS